MRGRRAVSACSRSRQGLNRVLGHRAKAPWREVDWRRGLRRLHEEIAPDLRDMDIGRLCAQDLQNCLCEFAKDERVRLGEGTRKRRFRPTNESRFVLACKKIVADRFRVMLDWV
jgi:hypothetical protein